MAIVAINVFFMTFLLGVIDREETPSNDLLLRSSSTASMAHRTSRSTAARMRRTFVRCSRPPRDSCEICRPVRRTCLLAKRTSKSYYAHKKVSDAPLAKPCKRGGPRHIFKTNDLHLFYGLFRCRETLPVSALRLTPWPVSHARGPQRRKALRRHERRRRAPHADRDGADGPRTSDHPTRAPRRRQRWPGACARPDARTTIGNRPDSSVRAMEEGRLGRVSILRARPD